jgi:hypothetical protein
MRHDPRESALALMQRKAAKILDVKQAPMRGVDLLTRDPEPSVLEVHVSEIKTSEFADTERQVERQSQQRHVPRSGWRILPCLRPSPAGAVRKDRLPDALSLDRPVSIA